MDIGTAPKAAVFTTSLVKPSGLLGWLPLFAVGVVAVIENKPPDVDAVIDDAVLFAALHSEELTQCPRA